MNIREIIKDKKEVLDQAFTLIESAIENDSKYYLSSNETTELVWELMERYATEIED